MNTPDSVLAACVWLSRHRLSVQHAMILLYVAKVKGAKMADLAKVGAVSTAAMTGTVDVLEHKGWIARNADEDDRRLVWAVMTPEGDKAIAEMFSEEKEPHELFSR